MSSKGAFLRLPRVAHRGGQAHLRHGAPKRPAHGGGAAPPAPPSFRGSPWCAATACASFSRPNVNPLSLKVLMPCCRLFAETSFERGVGRGSNDHRASGRSCKRAFRTGSGAGLGCPECTALPREEGRPWGGRPRHRAHICNSLLPWLGRLRRPWREPGTSAGTKGHCAFFFP